MVFETITSQGEKDVIHAVLQPNNRLHWIKVGTEPVTVLTVKTNEEVTREKLDELATELYPEVSYILENEEHIKVALNAANAKYDFIMDKNGDLKELTRLFKCKYTSSVEIPAYLSRKKN